MSKLVATAALAAMICSSVAAEVNYVPIVEPPVFEEPDIPGTSSGGGSSGGGAVLGLLAVVGLIYLVDRANKPAIAGVIEADDCFHKSGLIIACPD